MDRILISWNEFRKMHKGTPAKEISTNWKLYKKGEYDITVLNEVPRDAEEVSKLTAINSNNKTRSFALRLEIL